MSNRPENDETYFARDYRGDYMEEGNLPLGNYDSSFVYQCKLCFALTFNPAFHENWHRNVLWQPET